MKQNQVSLSTPFITIAFYLLSEFFTFRHVHLWGAFSGAAGYSSCIILGSLRFHKPHFHQVRCESEWTIAKCWTIAKTNRRGQGQSGLRNKRLCKGHRCFWEWSGFKRWRDRGRTVAHHQEDAEEEVPEGQQVPNDYEIITFLQVF